MLGCAGEPRLDRLMTWPEYGRVEHSAPYVLRVGARRGALLYFGARHIKGEPDHPQVARIERLWDEFRPTVAFNEGWDPPVVPDAREAVARYGEPGLVRYLAHRDGVPVDDLEPPLEERYRYLRRRFTPEQIRLFLIAQNVSQNLLALPPDEVDTQVLGQIRRHFEPQPLIAGPPRTIAEVDASFRRLLPHIADWRRIPGEETWPKAETFLGEIARYGGKHRDRHMVSLMIRSVREGERVFAVVGASHVVMQEPVLRDAFRGRVRLVDLPPAG